MNKNSCSNWRTDAAPLARYAGQSDSLAPRRSRALRTVPRMAVPTAVPRSAAVSGPCSTTGASIFVPDAVFVNVHRGNDGRGTRLRYEDPRTLLHRRLSAQRPGLQRRSPSRWSILPGSSEPLDLYRFRVERRGLRPLQALVGQRGENDGPLKQSRCGCALLPTTKPMPLPTPLEHQHAIRFDVEPGPLFVRRRWLVRDDHISFDAIGESHDLPAATGQL